MRVVLATDKFKGVFSSAEIAEFISKGMRHAHPKVQIQIKPLADGSEGTAAVLCRAMEFERFKVTTVDQFETPMETTLFWQRSRRIVLIETASLGRTLPRENISTLLLKTNSVGLGICIQKALDLRPKEIWIAAGEPPFLDGGWGLSHALGLRALDADQQELEPSFENFSKIISIQYGATTDLHSKVEIKILSDLNFPVLGANLNYYSYLEKIGIPKDLQIQYKNNFERFLKLLQSQLGVKTNLTDPFSGSSGAILFGLQALFKKVQATLGAETVAQATSFLSSLSGTDLVVIAAGTLHAHSLYGKVVSIASSLAYEKRIPIYGVFGTIPEDAKFLERSLGMEKIYTLFSPLYKMDSITIKRESPRRFLEMGSQLIEDFCQRNAQAHAN
jgi:glycerate kinase